MNRYFITVVLVLLAITGFCGWVSNILKLVDSTAFGWMEVVRLAGIFLAPLGAVLGFV